MRVRRLAPLLVVALVVGAAQAHAVSAGTASAGTSAAIESRILALINQGRSGKRLGALKMHSGLRTAGRGHSREMAADGSLSHSGFRQRVEHATPDPRQRGAPPDQGFHANGFAACENVARYRPAKPASETDVAQTMYKLWLNSTPHRKCMFDEKHAGFNAAGVGVYRDGSGGWWATLEVVRDATPPR